MMKKAGRPVPSLTAYPQGPMVAELKPGATFYVGARTVASRSGQLHRGMLMVNKAAGRAQVPVVWNGYEFEAQPFRGKK